jgi:ATP-dependent Clp protease adaptor protein ClpS
MPTAPAVLPELESETNTRRQPPYAVLIHNDDYNGMNFVVEVLQKVFAYTIEKCVQLMSEAHDKGLAVVWVGVLEVAELKADQIISCGPDPRSSSKRAKPIRVTIEPTE